MRLYGFILTFLASFVTMAQQGPHNGDIVTIDSLNFEIVYPSKKSSTFQIYITKNSVDMSADLSNAEVIFYFSRDNSDFVTSRVSKQKGFWNVTLEDWKDFHHADIKFELKGIKENFQFWNKKYQSQNKQEGSGGDHSGHSH